MVTVNGIVTTPHVLLPGNADVLCHAASSWLHSLPLR
jgi:hypothetical protein